jgi:membrane protein YdbS with pleckstrin-like domain
MEERKVWFSNERVWFSFFMILALTLNFGFFIGEMDDPQHHNVFELFAVIVVNMIATVLKLGDRTQMGPMLLATSLVALVQLISAAMVWAFAIHVNDTGLTHSVMATIVSLSGGAVLANVISVILLMIETTFQRR